MQDEDGEFGGGGAGVGVHVDHVVEKRYGAVETAPS